MRRLTAAVALLTATLSLGACSDRPGNAQTPSAPPAVPVGVATAEQRVVPVQVITVGNVQAYTTVGVKSQIAGQIQQVHFTEGQDVKRGDLLFTIDPRPLEAAVRQAEANVCQGPGPAPPGGGGARTAPGGGDAGAGEPRARRRPDGQRARAGAALPRARRRGADRPRAVRPGPHQLGRARGDRPGGPRGRRERPRRRAGGGGHGRQCARRRSGPTRRWSTPPACSSPTRRSGRRWTAAPATSSSRRGNVVKTGEDSPLVVIAQVHPIYVSFAVPEQHLTAIKHYRARG